MRCIQYLKALYELVVADGIVVIFIHSAHKIIEPTLRNSKIEAVKGVYKLLVGDFPVAI